MGSANPQTDSRLLDATHTALEVCDVDHSGFNKANAFILCAYSTGDSPHGNDNADYKMQWKRTGGSFADVGADTEICWADGVDFTPNIVDENTTVTFDSNCLTATHWAQNVGNNALAGAMTAPGGVLLLQWGLKFGSGALDSQEYEFQLVNITDSLSAICSVSITTAAGEVTAYDDITLKVTIESALTYDDITVKISLESQSTYDDITIKVSFDAAPSLAYDDITVKVSVDSALTYDDITVKITLESQPTFDDITAKVSLESALTYDDITVKISLESALTYDDITVKVSMAVENTKDTTVKVSLESALTYDDVTVKISLAAPGTDDVTIKVSFDAAGTIEAWDDITLKVSIDSALTYKDITTKVTFESQLTYDDVTVKISLAAEETDDITVKVSLESALTYDDITVKISLESALTYEDITVKASFEGIAYEDITVKVSVSSAPTYDDITIKVSLRAEITVAYKDVTVKVSLATEGQTDIRIRVSFRRMKWYFAYTLAINAFKDELEKISLSAFNNFKFKRVDFGPWEQLTDTPCCQILELEGMTETQIISNVTFLVNVPVIAHFFIAHPWKKIRGIRTAREAVLKTIGDVWDHFMKSDAKILNGNARDCVPMTTQIWDLDKDWNAYHAQILFSIQLFIKVT